MGKSVSDPARVILSIGVFHLVTAFFNSRISGEPKLASHLEIMESDGNHNNRLSHW